MKFKALIVALVAALTPAVATASAIQPGVYDVSDINWNREGVERSIWTGTKMVTGDGVSHLWSFSTATFEYNAAGNSYLYGSAQNVGDAALTFDFSFTFNTPTVGDKPGYCQFDGSGGDCVPGDPADPTMWTYLVYQSGTFTGTGAVMSGHDYTVTARGGTRHPFQAGINANALVDNGLNGMSFWFQWTQTGTHAASETVGGKTYAFQYSTGAGDVNANMAPVPLPAAGWLLIAGLGGLAAMRRRTA